jgi:hypothetical protein
VDDRAAINRDLSNESAHFRIDSDYLPRNELSRQLLAKGDFLRNCPYNLDLSWSI